MRWKPLPKGHPDYRKGIEDRRWRNSGPSKAQRKGTIWEKAIINDTDYYDKLISEHERDNYLRRTAGLPELPLPPELRPADARFAADTKQEPLVPSFKPNGSVEPKPGQVYLVYRDERTGREIRIPRDLVGGGRGAVAKTVAGKSEYLDEGEKRAVEYYSKFPGTARYAGTGADKHFETRTADGVPHSFVGTTLDKMRADGYATTMGPTSEEAQQSADDYAAIERAMRAVDRDYDRSYSQQAEVTDRRFREDMRAEHRPNDPPLPTGQRGFTTYDQIPADNQRRHMDQVLDQRAAYRERDLAERETNREFPPTETSYRQPVENSYRQPTATSYRAPSAYGPKTTFVDDMLRKLRTGR